ncbi:hypothetical protein B2J88_14615 [Rhodococcus sp. SRB_17]|uniref:hypothetical protein n=1 Tax=Rhodococcus sp. OK302 TaxID=1882769 RepID=UPI000B9461BB|nr:hypothetical protein [Rhodococcus sp. OK302]NMM85588.1 hypothetical protein [Rhodococcus sp. SRB_17]OYD70211.1 hypothetical protein BDB13_3808 [Rhodococcus sp. OK302]
MPLTVKHSETYNDALIALAAATHRPASVVNVAGDYAIRVDLEYNRYVVATNTRLGLSDEPESSDSWRVRFIQANIAGESDQLLAEASHQWLIDAFDSALESLEADGNKIVADANFGDISRSETSTSADVHDLGDQA